jgi:hypothetical protein
MKEVVCLQNKVELDANLSMDVRYADDTTLISAIFNLLQISTRQLEDACKELGLKINREKCRVITDEEVDEILMESNAVTEVQEFVFLGSVVPGTSSDIKRRIALAAVAFGKLKNNIWSNRTIPMNLKIRLYYALIIPIATYSCETWTATKEDCRTLQVFENNCLRMMLGIKLIDHVRIEEIHKKAGTKNTIVNLIKKRRLTWFGHVCRLPNDSLVQRMYKEDFKKKRKRGRPPKRWTDQIKEDTGLPLLTAEKYAKDRKRWRALVNDKWAKLRLGVCN